MAVESQLDGLFVGADQVVYYTDSDAVPTDMTGWTVKLDIRRSDLSSDALLLVTGSVSGTYANTLATNAQKVTFLLPKAKLAATIFAGEDKTYRYSIKRTDTTLEMPLAFGDVPITRVTQI